MNLAQFQKFESIIIFFKIVIPNYNKLLAEIILKF